MRYSPWFLTYLELIFAATVFFGIHTALQADPWAIGDWLINYHAGFVRRGLTGEVALGIGHALHFSPLVVVSLMQFACYAAVFYSVHRLLINTRLSFWAATLVLSPATLGFPILEQQGGFRKEIILIGGLGILILLTLRRPARNTLLVVYTSLLIVVCVLSHESLILFGAYIVAALAIGLGDIPRALKLSIVPAVLAVVALILVSHHPGNAQMARDICSSLGYPATIPPPAPCSGSIDYLGRNLTYAREQLFIYYRTFHYQYIYPVLAALALLPVALAYRSLWRQPAVRRSLNIIAAAALFSFAASSPLFYYALDWGRWIYIHVFCIMLLLLLVEHLRQKNAPPEPAATSKPARLRTAAGLVFLVLYATCWELPAVGGWPQPSGYVRIAVAMFKPAPPAPQGSANP
jgi:hypothetical protein